MQHVMLKSKIHRGDTNTIIDVDAAVATLLT
jgi:hypothetical protein